MIQLKTKGISYNISSTIVAEVTSIGNHSEVICYSLELAEFILLTIAQSKPEEKGNLKIVYAIPSLNHLVNGDIVMINAMGLIYTLWRTESPHNSLFITNRCNSNCLMCSQPPKNYDDLDHYFEINSQLIKMIPPSTKLLGITGGEPTLLGNRFITLLGMITKHMPQANIQVLTNGRSFAWKDFPKAIGKINNHNILFGIPLYSDYFKNHDYIVQVKHAFNQTVMGLHNMARYGLRTEIRVVLHKKTYTRLPSLAQYIYKNFPFVEHVAFMGLEYTGYTPHNSDLLWIEPSEYNKELEQAVLYLHEVGLNVSIYNLQLCLLQPTLWQFTKNSISDWKREFLDECKKCTLISNCSGVFATSKKHSNEIKAVLV